jgi:hypothetical protein
MASSPLTLQSLSVLYWLTQQPSREHYVPDEVCPTELQASVHHELASAGLIVNEAPAGGPPSFGIEPSQILAARSAASSYRQAAIQRHILDQLKKNRSVVDVASLPSPQLHGDAATEDEVTEAERTLTHHELIKGIPTWGRALLRPEITPAGEAVLRSPYAPEDALRINRHGGTSTSHYGDVNTIHQTGSGNASLVNMPGAHNSAEVNQTAPSARVELSEALDRIEEVLRQDAPEQAERLGGQIDLIRQMNRDDAEPGLIRQMVNGLSNGLGQVLGQRAPELIDTALSALPQV